MVAVDSFGDGSDDPLQARLEAVMGQERPPVSSDLAIGFGKRKMSAEVISSVTLNPKSVTEIINKLPDNLNGPVLPYRMISFVII